MPGNLVIVGTSVPFSDLVEFLRQGGTAEDFATAHGINAHVVRDALAETGFKLPDNGALALAFFNTARAEAVQRIGMRETTFTFWIATVGVILGLSVKAHGQPDPVWLSLIPILSVPFTFLIVRHTMIVTWISHFVRDELNPALRQPANAPGAFPPGPRHWDNSRDFSRRIRIYLWFENSVYAVLLVLPGISVDFWLAMNACYWQSAWFLLCAGCTALTAAGFILHFVLERR